MLRNLFIIVLFFFMICGANAIGMKRSFEDCIQQEWNEKLPFEVLSIIFEYLNISDSAQASLVCKSWNAMLHDEEHGNIGVYDAFRNTFNNLKVDFEEDSNFKNAGLIISKLRCACVTLNSGHIAKSQLEQTRFVKSLSTDIWQEEGKKIIPKLVNKAFTGNEIAVETTIGAKLDIKPVWMYLVLIRVFDGRMEEASD